MTFPIQNEWPANRYPPQRASIPWELIALHEKQAVKNHGGQTLSRLAERHGLSAEEAVAIIEDKEYCTRWRPTDGTREAQDARHVEAINRLDELCREHEREQFHTHIDPTVPLG